MVILALLACGRQTKGSDSVAALDTAVEGSLDFGAVPSGETSTRALRTGLEQDASADDAGLTLTWVTWSTGAVLLVTCDPDALTATSGNVSVGGDTFPWTCSGTDARKAPVVEIGAAAAASLPETGLGDAAVVADTRLVPVSRSGDLLLTDAAGGRVWRQDPFYKFGSWGVWGSNDEEEDPEWSPPPACFGEDGLSSHQSGICTGDERQGDGSIPSGWSFYHGGFVDGVAGVADAVDVPGPDVVVLAGEADGAGWLAVLDASLDVRLDDEDSYSYFRLVRAVDGKDLPAGLRVARAGEDAVAIGPDGSTFVLTGLDTTTPTLAKGDDLGADVDAFARDDDGALVLAGGEWMRVTTSVTPLPAADAWGAADSATPEQVASDGTRLWAYFGQGALGWRTLDGSDAGFQHVDGVTGVAADPLGSVWVTVGDELRLVDATGAPKAGTTLAATPIALGNDPLPHDGYVAYAAGSEGCDGALADLCTDGTHPTVVESFYAVAGLDLAVSTGHPMDLFFAPVIETPKDEAIDSDFSKGHADCGDAPEDVPPDTFQACCALEASSARVAKNLTYFTSKWTGATFALGVNPTWYRQARECLATTDGDTRDRGRTAITTLASFIGKMEFTRWTHTGLIDPEFDSASQYYVNRVVTPGSWAPPVDTQEEYGWLHQGLASMYELDDLGEMDGVPFSDYELPGIEAGAGNGFDGAEMLDQGWEDPSWVLGVRDGAGSDKPLRAFYFASAGSIPEVGLYGYRKKENFPLAMADRAGAFEMGSEPETWYQGGDTGMVYLGGMNWAINTVGDIADAGAFRETVIWGNNVETRDWEAVRRYIRRTLASADPDDVKSYYVHLFDLSNADGDFQDASGVSPEGDINVDGLAAINAELVAGGYARWVKLDDVVNEYQAAHP